jgi:endonuclease/exonuclease/phosphatase family metal-dependent hydrolase
MTSLWICLLATIATAHAHLLRDSNSAAKHSVSAGEALKVMFVEYNQENTVGNADTLGKIRAKMDVAKHKPDVIVVCTQESARTTKMWSDTNGGEGESAGTRPARYDERMFGSMLAKDLDNYEYIPGSMAKNRGMTDYTLNYHGHSILKKTGLNVIVDNFGTYTGNENKGAVWHRVTANNVVFLTGCSHLDAKSAVRREDMAYHVIKRAIFDKSTTPGKNEDEKKTNLAKMLKAGSAGAHTARNGMWHAVFIGGDLNYRLDAKDDDWGADTTAPKTRTALVQYLGDKTKWPLLFQQDLLNKQSILHATFGFTCNDPFVGANDAAQTGYAPTYKRGIGVAAKCEDFANTVNEETAKQCFFEGNVDKELKTKGGGTEIQTGYLDRVCFAAKEGVTVKKQFDTACEACIESDHIPIIVQYELKTPANDVVLDDDDIGESV